jgi:hypothetical protein
MENNKFNKFYSKKSVRDLMKQLLSQRITGSTLDNEWYDALKIHLVQRELNQDERKIFEKILETEPEKLKQEQQQITNDIKRFKETLSNFTLKKSGINAAGTSLKNIVYTAIVLILCTTIGIFISATSEDLETIKNTYIFLGILSLICNILILNSLYTAGEHLENS